NLGNTVYAAWGVAGGQSGRAGSVVINPGTARERTLDPISEANKLAPGDVVRIATSGGGGWGHPFDRPAAIVRAEVLNGFVSYESAFEDYGVVFDRKTGEIDEAATATRRRSCRPSAKLFHQREYVDEIW